jgi:hypothetical protein
MEFAFSETVVLEDELSGAVQEFTPDSTPAVLREHRCTSWHCTIAHSLSRRSLYFLSGITCLQMALPPDNIVEPHADRTSHSP